MSPVHIAAFLLLQTDDAAAPVAHSPTSGVSAVFDMVRNSGPVAIAVLVLLLIASLYSWAVILGKSATFRRARTQSRRFMRAFRKADRLQEIAAVSEQFKPSPLVTVFDEVYDTYRRQTGGFRTAQEHRHPGTHGTSRGQRVAYRSGAAPDLAGDDRRSRSIRRPLRHRDGDRGCLPRPGHRRRGHAARGSAWSFRSPDHHRRRPAGRHSRRHRLQPVHRFAARVWLPHGRLLPRIAQQPGRDQLPNRKRWRGRPRVAFTASSGHTRTSLAEINITPLVDVVLVLLIIFMVTAPVLQSGIDVSVPKTRSVKEITQQRLVLTIDRDQNVFLGDKPVNLAQLPTLLHQPKTDPAQPGHLSAGRRAGSLWCVRFGHGRGQASRDHQHQHRDPAAAEDGEVAGHGRDLFQRTPGSARWHRLALRHVHPHAWRSSSGC